MFILIVLIFTSAGPHSLTVSFKTEAACFEAAREIYDVEKMFNPDVHVDTFCYKK